MAIAERTVTTATAGAGSSSLTISLPTGAAAGDLCLITISIGNAGATSPTVTSPAGWAAPIVNQADSAGAYLHVIFERVLTSGDITAGSVTIGWSTSTARAAAWAQAWSGVDTGTPEDATRTVATGNSGTPTGTALTTTTDGAYLVCSVSTGGNGASNKFSAWSTPTGEGTAYAEFADVGDGAVATDGGASHIKTTAGASGAPSNTASQVKPWVFVLIALRQFVPTVGPVGTRLSLTGVGF